MDDDYEIYLSRTPDGQLIATIDEKVPLASDCLIDEPGDKPDTVFIHLDVIHNGSVYPVWVCDSQDRLNDPDLESKLEVEKRDDIIAAIKKLEAGFKSG